MHRRLLPHAALIGSALAMAPRSVWAGKYDLDLTRLATVSATGITQDNAGFRSLVSELGAVMAPRPADPADSLGLSGFAISADVGLNTISDGASYWDRASDGEADRVAPTLQIIGRKGLWPGLELGGGATHLFDSRMWAITGYAKAALHEGFHHLPIPTIAIRGSFSRLLGAKDLSLTTAAPAVEISHVFGLGKTFNVTPYVGYEALFVLARSTVLDATPNCDEFPDSYNMNCPGGANGMTNEFVFRNAGAIVRHRPFFGARMIFSVIRLGFEAMFAPPGNRDGKLGGRSIADNSKLQQQYTFSMGLDF